MAAGSLGKQIVTLTTVFFVIGQSEADLSSIVHASPDYSRLEIPPNSYVGSPLQVNVSINVRNILEVNEKSQYLTIESSLRMLWYDTRLRPLIRAPDAEFLSLNGKSVEEFWIPDIFVDQAKSLRSPTIHVKPATLRIHRDGLMRYSTRVNYDVACNMDFHMYPVDQQVCEIKFESFGHSSDQMSLAWLPESSHVNPNISLDQFDAEVVFQSAYATDYYALDYPGVILRIYLSRKINYHLLQTYVPSLLFVIIAWLSLFINPDAIPGRVSMVMMTLLTLMAMFSGVRQNTPKVSYVSFLDIWMVMCIFFIFLVLIEFSCVSALIRRNKRNLAEKIEQVGLLLLPLFLIIFNVIYWICLLLS